MIMSADYMDIRREGIQIGEARGEVRGEARGRILQSVDIYRNEMQLDDDRILQKIMEKFHLTEPVATEYLKTNTNSAVDGGNVI